MSKYRNQIVWSLMGMVFILAWISIRSQEDQMLYTLLALGMWGLTYVVNRYLKQNEENQEEE